LARADVFRAVGGFDERWRAGDFIDWFIRARERGLRHTLLPDLVLWRRIHDANLGVRERANYVDLARIIKAARDRRRTLPN
jgi:GT2 family glycosyltransferase